MAFSIENAGIFYNPVIQHGMGGLAKWSLSLL